MKTKAFTKEKKSGKLIKGDAVWVVGSNYSAKLMKKKKSFNPLPIPSMSFKYMQFL